MKEKGAGDIETLKKWYAEQLERKDSIIDRLREENAALLKTALEQGRKLAEFETMLKGLTGKK